MDSKRFKFSNLGTSLVQKYLRPTPNNSPGSTFTFGKVKRPQYILASFILGLQKLKNVIFLANKENRESDETTLTILEEQQNAIS